MTLIPISALSRSDLSLLGRNILPRNPRNPRKPDPRSDQPGVVAALQRSLGSVGEALDPFHDDDQPPFTGGALVTA